MPPISSTAVVVRFGPRAREPEASAHVFPPDTVKEERGLTGLALNRLLSWLDDGVESQGETYLEMRRRLSSYFDRRNRLSADELADETLNRIGRTLEKDGTIATTPPARYCYVVARFVLLEDIRRQRTTVALKEPWMADASTVRGAGSGAAEASLAEQEERLECLDRCLGELKPDQRELVIEYYRDTGRQKIERRRDLANRLGITMNALGIRACRIRNTLEAGVESCCQQRRRI
jgi:DNA-directed RNA polymerase specialized sigma24 family protein